MNWVRSVWLLLILSPMMLIIDLLWLGVVMKDFYAQEIGGLLRREGDVLAPRWGAAAAVYVLIPAGLVLFVRPLLTASDSRWNAFRSGALFGLVLYGVYDFTNLAILEKWTVAVTLADIAWGSWLCGVSTCLMQSIDAWLTPTDDQTRSASGE